MIEHTYSEELYLISEKVTIIIPEPWAEVAEADRQLLQKILQSVRLNLASVRIIHSSEPSQDARICFGATDVKTEGNTVHAPSLTRLQNDPAGKQKLWVALKGLFGL